MLEKLDALHVGYVGLAGMKLKLIINPVRGANGERLGAVMQWVDETAQVAIESEIDTVVQRIADAARRMARGEAFDAGVLGVVSPGSAGHALLGASQQLRRPRDRSTRRRRRSRRATRTCRSAPRSRRRRLRKPRPRWKS